MEDNKEFGINLPIIHEDHLEALHLGVGKMHVLVCAPAIDIAILKNHPLMAGRGINIIDISKAKEFTPAQIENIKPILDRFTLPIIKPIPALVEKNDGFSDEAMKKAIGKKKRGQMTYFERKKLKK